VTASKSKTPSKILLAGGYWRATKKPVLTEEQKTLKEKRDEPARVQERLRSPDLRPGIERVLRKRVAILEREIAELEG